MKKIYLLLSFMFIICHLGYTQNTEKLCVCFDQMNDFIDIKIQDKDSTHTYFKIIREGFEKEELRKKALHEYRKNMFDLPPDFFMTFVAVQKPKKIYAINEVNCAAIVSLDKYRKNNYRRPVGTRSNLFIFVQRNIDKTFLTWDVLMEPVE